MSTYIIAEAGVNHNGSLEMAKALAKVAKEAGADAVKYQTFRAENLVTINAKQADYQVDNLGAATSQYEMLKRLELSFDEFRQLQAYCNSIQIEFLSTAFDVESLHFLVEDLQVQTLKVPSGELTNYPLLVEMAAYRLPLIISTGMAMLGEIEEALSFIAYRLCHEEMTANIEVIQAFYKTEEAKRALAQYVTLLHCTTSYPTPIADVNLLSIDAMATHFQLPIGFSDHSEGILASIGAVAKGATVIEKHFTLSQALEGPDHVASLEPEELKQLVHHIRVMERLLGKRAKSPTQVELTNKGAARKSLVAKKAIQQGERFTDQNVAVKRPGTGMEPKQYWKLLGKYATKTYEKDELLNE